MISFSEKVKERKEKRTKKEKKETFYGNKKFLIFYPLNVYVTNITVLDYNVKYLKIYFQIIFKGQ